MAKRVSKTQMEYNKVRKNLLQNIRRLEKRGYEVGINVPQRPDKITRKDINELKKLNKQRYKHVTYTAEEIVGEPGQERLETRVLTGYERRRQERKISASKGKITKLYNKAKRDTKDLQDYRKSHAVVEEKTYEYSPYEDYHIEDPAELKTEKRPEDYLREEANRVNKQSADYYNPETGEVISRMEWLKRGKSEQKMFIRAMPAGDVANKMFNNVMKTLDMMSAYDGSSYYDKKGKKHTTGKKHDAVTRSNADAIKDFINERYAENPAETSRIIAQMEEQGDFDLPDFFYFAGGYQRFISRFTMMFDYNQDLDAMDQNNDSNDYYDFELDE